MSSTVTTTTVSTVTAAATFENLGAVLTLVALLMLGVALLAREIMTSAKGESGRRIARGVDLALMPLMVTFAIVMAISSQVGM